jgi:cytochrome P450
MTLPLPPGPRGGLFLGAFREVQSDKLAVMTRYQREHGDVVGLRLGPMRIAAVYHPALIEQALLKLGRSMHKGLIEQLVRPAAGNGIFLSEDDFWKRQRRMVSPPFHKARLAGYARTMAEITTRVSAGWQDGEARDVYRDTSRIGMAVAAKVMFNVDVEARDGEELGSALADMMDAVTARIDSPIPWPDFVPTPTMLRLRAAVRRLDALVYDAIARRRREQIERDDLLSLLLAARDEDDGQGMTDRQVRDEAMNLFIAGFETTAINLAWTLDLLSRHPEVQAAVRGALPAPAATGEPPRVPLVEQVINESLRLYPPAWAFDRVAIEDVELGGYRIPKGWGVWFSPWVTHRDPRFWREPERFLPERWAGDEAKQRHKYSFIPFGGGPRICIGNGFALLEAQVVLATLLPAWRFEPIGEPPRPDPGFTLRPRPAVRQRVIRVDAA